MDFSTFCGILWIENGFSDVKHGGNSPVFREILVNFMRESDMNILSIDEQYSIGKIREYLNLSTLLARGLKNNFGDPITIRELSRITKEEFTSFKYLGIKRWKELQKALSKICLSESSVSFVKIRGANNIIVEIDVSKPFSSVIKDLSFIIQNYS